VGNPTLRGVILAGLLATWGCSAGSTGGQNAGSGGSSGSGGSTMGIGNGGSAGSNGPGSGGSTGVAGSGGPGTGGSGSGSAGSAGAAGGGAGGSSSTGPVTVQLGQTEQSIDGFGINDTWAPAMTMTQATALFSATGGIGLTILRVGMGPDGNPMSANIPGDITMAKMAGATTIIGSTWTPPANCKTNNNINDGGHVISNDGGTCYNMWAASIVKFATDQKVNAMSIANEPDFASCGTTEPCNGNYPTTLYTATELVNFVKNVGPKLHQAGIKVIAPEASEWNHNWSNTSACCSQPSGKQSTDPLKCGFQTIAAACTTGGGYDYGHWLYKDSAAWAAFDIMGVHQYDSQVASPWPSDVPSKKPVWQTEMSGVKWWAEQGPSSDIANGVAVAGWIHDALTTGQASAWLWWWYQANNTDDNEGLILKNGTDTKRHYVLGNYSKFVRPGYTRVDVTGGVPANVLLSAYKGTDGTVVVVAVNKGTAAVSVPISIAGGTAPASLTPWVTSAADNLASKAAVPVSGGSFTAALAATTVTTFVGK
jgi:glucuronoarabinoxylan endo-1,4-beta-xylanase